MKMFSGFRVPKTSRFNYIPQYYDPDKEAFEERMREVELREQDSSEGMKSRIAVGLKYGRGDRAYRKNLVAKSNYRLLGLIVLLVLITFFCLNKYLPRILEFLE